MDTYRVELVNRGGIEIDVVPDIQILDAIEALGLRVPVGCRDGVCITCAAKLIIGEVDRSAERCLKPDQIAAGYVLCVAYVRSDCRFEVGIESQSALYPNPFRGRLTLGTFPSKPGATTPPLL
jgi:ferredoxin